MWLWCAGCYLQPISVPGWNASCLRRLVSTTRNHHWADRFSIQLAFQTIKERGSVLFLLILFQVFNVPQLVSCISIDTRLRQAAIFCSSPERRIANVVTSHNFVRREKRGYLVRYCCHLHSPENQCKAIIAWFITCWWSERCMICSEDQVHTNELLGQQKKNR